LLVHYIFFRDLMLTSGFKFRVFLFLETMCVCSTERCDLLQNFFANRSENVCKFVLKIREGCDLKMIVVKLLFSSLFRQIILELLSLSMSRQQRVLD
jgi:hypothetical protein